jgi:hypothetical protein
VIADHREYDRWTTAAGIENATSRSFQHIETRVALRPDAEAMRRLNQRKASNSFALSISNGERTAR